MDMEHAAQSLQRSLDLPQSAVTVLIWNSELFSGLKVWIEDAYQGRIPEIPDAYEGYAVHVERRPSIFAH